MNLKATNCIRWAFFVFLVSALLVSASNTNNCSENWIAFGDSCIFISPNNNSWEDAKTDCTGRSNTSTLLNIRNEQDHDSLKDLLANITNSSVITEFYIGLTGRKEDGQSHLVFTWTNNNTEYNFTNWRYANTTNATLYNSDDKVCALYDSGFKWRLINCTQKSRYICQQTFSNSSRPDDSAADSGICSKGWHELQDWCIYISNTNLSWHDAYQYCRNNASHLAIASSKNRNAQIVVSINAPSEYYIGLYRNINSTARWVSGAEVYYSNWRSLNESNKVPDPGGRLCAFYGPDNKWAFGTSCLTERRFICQRKIPSSSSGNSGKHKEPPSTANPKEVVVESVEQRIDRLKGKKISKDQANQELENFMKDTLAVNPENMSAADISNVVEKVEAFGQVIIEGIKKNGHVNQTIMAQVTSDAIVIGLIVIPANSTSMVQFPQDSSGGTIKVPGSVIEVVEETPGNSDGVGMTAVFLPEVGKGKKSNTKKDPVLNSGVISAKFYVDEGTLNNLKNPVVIYLPHVQKLKDGERPACVFIDPKSSKYSTEGCKVAASNSTHTVCHCTHLTNFAVLLDVYGDIDETPEEHKFALLIVTIVGCCIALVCFIATLIAFQFVITDRLRRKTETISIHKNLAIAEIFALAFFLLAYGVGEPKGLCFAVAFVLHYFLMAVFFWMLVEGLNLHRGTVQVFMTTSRMKVYYIIGWGVPLVFVIATAAVGQMEYMRKDFCWLSKEFIWVFAGPVAVILFINLIILCIAIRVMVKRPRYKTNKVDDASTATVEQELRIAFKTTIILLPLLGLTWCLGFLATNSVTGNVIIQYVFAIVNSLQGLYFFVAHCLYDEDVRKKFFQRIRNCGQNPFAVQRASNKTSTRLKTFFTRSISRSRGSTSSSNQTNAYRNKPYNGGNLNLFELPSTHSAPTRFPEQNDLKNSISQNNGHFDIDARVEPKPKANSESYSENCFKQISFAAPRKPLTNINSLPGECSENIMPKKTKEKPLDDANGDVGSHSEIFIRRANSAIVKLSEKRHLPRRSHSIDDLDRLKLSKQTSIDSTRSGNSNTGFLSGC